MSEESKLNPYVLDPDPIFDLTPPQANNLVTVTDLPPTTIPLLPVAQTTLFPGMMVPLILPEGKLSGTLEFAADNQGFVGVVLYEHMEQDGVATGPSTSVTGLPVEGSVPKPSKAEADFFPFGVAAKVLKKINLPDNQVSVLLTGLQRFEINEVIKKEPYFIAKVDYLFEELHRDTELEAMLRSALSQFKQISKDNPLISEEVKVALINIDGPGKLSDFIASVLVRDVSDYQQLLKAADVKERLQHLLLLLKKEQDVQSVQRKIQDEINQKVNSAQREFYLQEQLKFIQKELGRQDERSRIIDKFRDRLKAKTIAPATLERINEEFEKVNAVNEQSAEYSVLINYLDWASSLPWGDRSPENHDLERARKILDADHYGLKDVKERILEFLAVKKLKQTSEGSIICFVGPPGTGKTSLGKSIAKALQRKFFRFSVGGMRDEAEIKGHRKTYVGAMPGKMIQGLKRVGSQNPVFLIDEIDKMGSSVGSGGDPASALLELLDPEQNSEFLDHYLDIPFNCSEVFFITTANTLDTIPSALLDRMEVIELHGYSDVEKLHIAKRYLVPKQIEKNALTSAQFSITDRGLKHIIERYARESGVRNLEKQVAKLARKVALKIALKKGRAYKLDSPPTIEKLLGPAPFHPEDAMKEPKPGVATGLAWTAYGGEVLFVESVAVAGRSGFMLTGSLGEVMQESAKIAYTYIRMMASIMKLPVNYFERNVLHLHVPSGATPKDGPSAGVTMVASLYSLLTNRPMRGDLAMTGEITLTGKILPVGGIKEKVLAAKRSGIKNILLPKANQKDLKELEDELRSGMKFILVAHVREAMKHIFV